LNDNKEGSIASFLEEKKKKKHCKWTI